MGATKKKPCWNLKTRKHYLDLSLFKVTDSEAEKDFSFSWRIKSWCQSCPTLISILPRPGNISRRKPFCWRWTVKWAAKKWAKRYLRWFVIAMTLPRQTLLSIRLRKTPLKRKEPATYCEVTGRWWWGWMWGDTDHSNPHSSAASHYQRQHINGGCSSIY